MTIALLSRPLTLRSSSLAQQIVAAAGGASNVAATFLYGVRATTSGGTLSAWADANGGSPTLAQATGANQPADSGADYVFDGVDDKIGGAFTWSQPETVFYVVKQIVWTNGRYLADGTPAADNRMAFLQRTVSPGVQQYAGSFGAASSDLAVGTYAVVTIIYNGASSSMQVNDGTITTGATGASNAGGLTLGQTGLATTLAANCAYKAAVCAKGALTVGQRTAVKNILYATYGITP